jgi:hypothetical protein
MHGRIVRAVVVTTQSIRLHATHVTNPPASMGVSQAIGHPAPSQNLRQERTHARQLRMIPEAKNTGPNPQLAKWN